MVTWRILIPGYAAFIVTAPTVLKAREEARRKLGIQGPLPSGTHVVREQRPPQLETKSE